jgi:hypothetical protein
MEYISKVNEDYKILMNNVQQGVTAGVSRKIVDFYEILSQDNLSGQKGSWQQHIAPHHQEKVTIKNHSSWLDR